MQTQIVTKFKNSNGDWKKKKKLWQNSRFDKTKIMTKLKNYDCDKTLKLNWLQNSKTAIGTKLLNLNGYKTQKLKLWPKSKLKLWRLKTGQNAKSQMWQNSNYISNKTQNLTKLKLCYNVKT